MKNFFLPLLGLMLFLVARPATAQTYQAETVTEALKYLNGSWQWTESRFASRGVPPSTKTPESTKRNIVVTFKPDNQVLVFENKQLMGTYTYTVSRPMDEYLMIRFSGGPKALPISRFLEEGPLMISAAEMTIAGGYNDAGSNQSFKKITAAKAPKAPKINKKPATK